jgi:nitrogen fixation protein FixH
MSQTTRDSEMQADPSVARSSEDFADIRARDPSGGLLANRWMLVPVLLLGMTVTIGTVTVLSAVVGHPLGMEPDYDRKAASWESEREQRAMNERLRWVVTPEVGSEGAHRTVSIRVEDKHAARIDAQSVVVECIPVKAAEARRTVELVRRDAGEFAGSFDSPIGGQWEFRVTVVQGGVRYTDGFRRFLTGVRGATTNQGVLDGHG